MHAFSAEIASNFICSHQILSTQLLNFFSNKNIFISIAGKSITMGFLTTNHFCYCFSVRTGALICGYFGVIMAILGTFSTIAMQYTPGVYITGMHDKMIALSASPLNNSKCFVVQIWTKKYKNRHSTWISNLTFR